MVKENHELAPSVPLSLAVENAAISLIDSSSPLDGLAGRLMEDKNSAPGFKQLVRQRLEDALKLLI